VRNLDYIQLRVNEALRPSLTPTNRRTGDLGRLGLGQVGGPRFFDASGNTITTIECGQSYAFEVPGYTNVWLTVMKDGVTTYDSATQIPPSTYSVPMPPYQSICGTDSGHYEVIVRDPVTGQEIGRATLDITGGGLFGLSSSTLMVIGGIGLALLVMRKRK